MKINKRLIFLILVFTTAICMIPFRSKMQRLAIAAIQVAKGKKTVADRVEQYGTSVRTRLKDDFKRIGGDYPPQRIILAGFKQEKLLEVWVSNPPQLLKSYPILGTSGTLGPKLQEGDLQMPEGIYKIESLNPNSLYHLALRVNYPNQFDKNKGKIDGRTDLGGDIMIHGKNCSIGCLAMGDEAAEELFILAAETEITNISVILSPIDFRKNHLPQKMPPSPNWTPELYNSIKQELFKLQ